MADSVGPSSKNIPTTFSKVAGYSTGGENVIWTTADAERFKTSSVIDIDQSQSLLRFGQGVSDVADIETGAGTITAFIVAAENRVKLGKRNGLYCSFDSLPANVEAIGRSSVSISTVDFWVANWNLNQAEASAFVGLYTVNGLKINVVAVQWASPTSNPDTNLPGSSLTLKESNVDLSETAENWFPYVPPKPPVVNTTKTGVVVTSDLETYKILSTDSGKSWKQS
jgi:hypothetical protein